MFSRRVIFPPDWIAHGIMDSIVDSFFPFLEDIEKEVAAIETLVFASDSYADHSDQSSLARSSSSVTVVPEEKSQKSPSLDKGDPLRMKQEDTIHSVGAKTHFSLPQRPRRTWRMLSHYWQLMRDMLRVRTQPQQAAAQAPSSTVHRMAKARRLVTSLGRVLTAKSEVVTQLKKRLLTGATGMTGGAGDEQEVFMYMGDVQGMYSCLCSPTSALTLLVDDRPYPDFAAVPRAL